MQTSRSELRRRPGVPVAPAQVLRVFKVTGLRHTNAAFRLDRFHEERGMAPGRQFFFESSAVAERHRHGFRKKRPETLTPILTVHQGQCATGQAMEGAVAGEQTNAPRVGSRELDRGFDTFAS